MRAGFFKWEPIKFQTAILPAFFTIIAPGFTEEVTPWQALLLLLVHLVKVPCSHITVHRTGFIMNREALNDAGRGPRPCGTNQGPSEAASGAGRHRACLLISRAARGVASVP